MTELGPRIDEFIAPKCDQQIEIVYEDDTLLVINKPNGLLSLSGKHPQNLDSVHYRLVQQYPDCRLVHRLDLGTSGLLLVAKNKAINALLCRQFSERQVQKRYQAVLVGHVAMDMAMIDVPIVRGQFPLMKACRTGKPAQTLINGVRHITGQQLAESHRGPRLHNEQPLTVIEYQPNHGRTHQLRVHSHYIGHPIIGCDLYANHDSEQQASRLMLHASQLSFTHPVSHQFMQLQSASGFV